ncbi:peptidoglycan-binding domain-containing protein [Streptomyces sp. NPDC046716]|uniref:peptidoglycan-binding domain-containing protein n=1 Tax=Streptomyces sp. NPDC046716 TaxID=3157093 RepID=UPI003407C78E
MSELQGRLQQLSLYFGRPDGRYGRQTEFGVRNYQMARGIQGDESGTYGPATRRALEAETH